VDLGRATQLEGTAGRYRADLPEAWSGPFALYGGLLAALALRAAARASDLERPASCAVHYLAPVQPGPAELEVASLSRTRRLESLRVGLTQNGVTALAALVLLGSAGEGFEHDRVPLPAAPPPEALQDRALRWRADGRSELRVWSALEGRFSEERPLSGSGPVRDHVDSWWRTARPEGVPDAIGDALRALAVLDGAFHDALFAAQGGSGDFGAYPYRMPSADLLVHFHRAAPDSEWLFCRARSELAEAGIVSGDARLWSREGRLLASGRGLIACRPRGRKQ
jgi:acyl-CoA thioesterase